MSMMARFENLESAIQGAYLNPPQTPTTGGEVFGPSSSTDNAVARFDGTSGKLIQNSVTTIDDTGNASGILSQQFSNGTAVTLAAGKFWYDGTDGSWNAGMGGGNITQQIGEEIFVYGKASAAITDSPLQIVYKTGVVGASGVIKFAPAAAGITDADQILGIATESLALNAFGRVTNFGIVHGITTNGTAFGEVWADNDDIWYNPTTGNPTKTKPSAPGLKVQIGTVINAGSGGSGSFFVKIGSSSTLGGTDANVQFGTLANNNLIAYDSTAGYWKNVTASSIGLGTVSSVSVVSANGLAGTVATATTTPAITLSTTITGLLKGNGTAISAATSGTDYAPATSGTSILYGNGSGGFSNVTIGTGVAFAGGTLSATGSGGTVTSVTGTAPVVSSGGATPAISMAAATTSVNGYLTSTDWNTFNGKGSGTVTSVAALTLGTTGTDLTSTVATGTTTPVITLNVPTASASNRGALSAADWTTFNSKGSGTVTSVAQSFTGGLISVAGSPITTSGTLALTVAGTSGGIPYFSSASTWATSAALAASALVVGGGAGAAPATTTTGTGVVTALGVNTGTAGAFVVNGGALGTPSSGTVTNLTGTASININGTVGATTASTGAFTTLSATGITTVAAGTALLPAIVSTTGTADTGLWFPAADTIAASTGGTERLRIISSGSVGIGTTTPAAILQTQQTSAGARVTGALIQNVGSSASTAVSLDFAPHESSASPTTLARIDAIRTAASNAPTDLAFSTFNATLQERARIDSSGNLLVGVTSANANGGVLQLKSGITFPATQVSATDVNTLDDYEEGTWTPTDASGASLSFTTASCRYTKIGRVVVIQGQITYPITANASNAIWGGFPFNSADTITLSVIYSDASVANFTYLSGNTGNVYLLIPGVNVVNSTMSGKTVIFSGTYAT